MKVDIIKIKNNKIVTKAKTIRAGTSIYILIPYVVAKLFGVKEGENFVLEADLKEKTLVYKKEENEGK